MLRLTEAEEADYQERAAIVEYDAKLPRAKAEAFALACVLRSRKGQRGLPLVKDSGESRLDDAGQVGAGQR